MSNKELRPKKLEDYIGQEDIKEQLSISIEASKKRNRQLPHTLFFGGAGLGKTTLSTIVATEFGSNIFFANAANIQTQADLLNSLKDYDFIIEDIERDAYLAKKREIKGSFKSFINTLKEDIAATKKELAEDMREQREDSRERRDDRSERNEKDSKRKRIRN